MNIFLCLRQFLFLFLNNFFHFKIKNNYIIQLK
ncbi:MAG: hypothetical protein AB2N28_1660 [Candidatus Phytoplasma solani]